MERFNCLICAEIDWFIRTIEIGAEEIHIHRKSRRQPDLLLYETGPYAYKLEYEIFKILCMEWRKKWKWKACITNPKALPDDYASLDWTQPQYTVFTDQLCDKFRDLFDDILDGDFSVFDWRELKEEYDNGAV